MSTITHFSFDLWYTLIRSNPEFKKQRAIYFHQHFNTLYKSIEEVEHVFRQVDTMCNTTNEFTGKNIDADEMYLMVIYLLNNSLEAFSHLNMNELYNTLEEIFFDYSPVLFHPDTHRCLTQLKKNASLNILSNTAFIKGQSLRYTLDKLELTDFFDFQIYSDEVGVSKPNTAIYTLLYAQVKNIYPTQTIALNQIMHIGDNPIADIKGATNFGIHAFQINTNDKLIIDILN